MDVTAQRQQSAIKVEIAKPVEIRLLQYAKQQDGPSRRNPSVYALIFFNNTYIHRIH